MNITEVEFLQEGHAAQHREQAAEEQQQARLPSDITPPIMVCNENKVIIEK